jgi:hypothetical protein
VTVDTSVSDGRPAAGRGALSRDWPDEGYDRAAAPLGLPLAEPSSSRIPSPLRPVPRRDGAPTRTYSYTVQPARRQRWDWPVIRSGLVVLVGLAVFGVVLTVCSVGVVLAVDAHAKSPVLSCATADGRVTPR